MVQVDQPTRKRIAAVCCAAALTAGVAACNEPWWEFGLGSQNAAPANSAPQASGDQLNAPGANVASAESAQAGDGVYVLRVHFDILRADLPIGEQRQSHKIWNHVNEALGDPALTALLARNGFRLGIGTVDDWPAIRAILELNQARTTRVARTLQEGAPLTVPLGEVEDGTSYFLHRRGGSLGGGTFSAGQRAFRIEFALDLEDPQRVILQTMPTFEEDRSRPKQIERDGEVVVVRDREGRVFRELAVETKLAPGEFLVIGGSPPAEKGFVLGSCWLDSMLELQKFETVLFVSAQAVRIE